jgi:hypothetical protein
MFAWGDATHSKRRMAPLPIDSMLSGTYSMYRRYVVTIRQVPHPPQFRTLEAP